MTKKTSVTPEALLKDHPAQVQTIAQELRSLIISVVPEAIEKVYTGWHGIGYTHPKAGYFCCIFPMADGVRLAFEHGASLPDPDKVMKLPPTSSKQVRYVELQEDIPEDAIVALLHAAVSLK